MMASLSFYAILLIFFNVKVTFEQVTFYSGKTKVKIANLLRKRGYKLAVPPLESLDLSDEPKCLTACVKNDKCYSVNTKKLENENVMCDLLNRTMYHYPENLTKSEGSSHWYTKTPCVPNPCEIYATCVPKDSASIPFICFNATTCLDYYKSGSRTDDIYQIYSDGHGEKLPVMCDMNGGGWTVFQHRSDGSVDFYLGWTEYKEGFGNMSGEFWLGLENLHRITTSRKYKLRIDLEDFEGNKKFAQYSTFEVGNESDGYRLSIGAYSGDAGNSLQLHDGMKFTTKDSDHDLSRDNCAQKFAGAWWYQHCHQANLNGLYHNGGIDSPYGKSIIWYQWKGHQYSMKTVTMKIKEV